MSVNGSSSPKGLTNGILNARPEFASQNPKECDEVESLAIIGFSLEFPDEVTSSDSLWKLLMEKRNTVKEFPRDRLNVDAMYHPDSNRRGQVSNETSSVQWCQL